MDREDDAQNPQVSIIIPTYRRHALLGRCLKALFAQSLDQGSFEIIVCDDAASAQSQAFVKRFVAHVAARPKLRYAAVHGKHGPAAARNVGARLAQAQILAFTDDDTIPDPDWLSQGLSAFTRGVIAVAGQMAVPLSRRPTDYEKDAAELAKSEFVTANCFIRRDCFFKVRGFDERFRIAWREDSDIHFSLLKLIETENGRIARAPRAVVVHPIRPAPWGVSLRLQKKSLFNALLYKKHPGLYRKRIQRRPPLHYYAIATAPLVGALGAACESQMVFRLGLLGWMSLTAAFCASRLKDTSKRPAHMLEMAVTSILIPFLSIYWRIRGALKFRVWFL